MSRALARHETVNGRKKEYAILRNVFCCNRKLHIYAFNAIAALTQIEKENGRPVFETHNYVDPIIIWKLILKLRKKYKVLFNYF